MLELSSPLNFRSTLINLGSLFQLNCNQLPFIKPVSKSLLLHTSKMREGRTPWVIENSFVWRKKFSAVLFHFSWKNIALVSMKLETLSEIWLIWLGYLSHQCWNNWLFCWISFHASWITQIVITIVVSLIYVRF